VDWTTCPDVESVPDRCSGAWVVKGTRVLVQGILDTAEDASADEIADMFELPVDVVRRILEFAGPPLQALRWPPVDPILTNPEVVGQIAQRAFARAAREAIEENGKSLASANLECGNG
jgi:uncharacterized protein (DUF433 family)